MMMPMPRLGRETHPDDVLIPEMVKAIAKFFKGDALKTTLWFLTANPLLGNIAPPRQHRPS